MTSDQNEHNFKKLTGAVAFHVKNTALHDSLLAFLNKHAARLKASPASSKHHHAEIGGLLRHTVEVIDIGIGALSITQSFIECAAPVRLQQQEDLVVAAVVHDLHKMGDPFGREFYQKNMIKNGTVQSTAIPYERNANSFLLKHHLPASSKADVSAVTLAQAVATFVDRNCGDIQEGELSLLLVAVLDPALYVLLNDEVKFCVRYHDGAYSASGFELAGKETPTMLALHYADMVSSRADRWRAK